DRPPNAMHQEHLIAHANVAAADIAVVLANGLDHFIECQVVSIEPVGLDAYLVLLLETAPGVDLRGPFHGAHFGLDDPVLNGPHIGDVVALPRDHIMKHFAQAGCHRAHSWA